jgi:drug/metabolite transporter (DMT)-like permease
MTLFFGELILAGERRLRRGRNPSLDKEFLSGGRMADALWQAAISPSRNNRTIGAAYAGAAALCIAAQHPFSTLAARKLSAAQFICVTQFALVVATLIALLSGKTRSDFWKLVTDLSSIGKVLLLTLLGLAGVLAYELGLSDANPILIAAVLNLEPFWAAIVARAFTGKGLPTSLLIFVGCFAVAFTGALMIAWSQAAASDASPLQSLAKAAAHAGWLFAIPVPVLYALSGTFVGKWFPRFDESASLAAIFAASALILIPGTAGISYLRSETLPDAGALSAVLLLMIGTFVSAALGRVIYQKALTATSNDNGYVSVFLLAIPAITCLLSAPMSLWIPELKFVFDSSFLVGMVLVAAPLLAFAFATSRSSA